MLGRGEELEGERRPVNAFAPATSIGRAPDPLSPIVVGALEAGGNVIRRHPGGLLARVCSGEHERGRLVVFKPKTRRGISIFDRHRHIATKNERGPVALRSKKELTVGAPLYLVACAAVVEARRAGHA